VRVLGNFSRRFGDNQASSHSKVHDPLRGSITGCRYRRRLPCPAKRRTLARFRFRCRSIALEIEHDVLARAVHSQDLLSLERRGNYARRRFERLLSRTDPNRFDGISGDALIQAARNGFDFRKFGHIVRIQDAQV
jgi:hypothetical protein